MRQFEYTMGGRRRKFRMEKPVEMKHRYRHEETNEEGRRGGRGRRGGHGGRGGAQTFRRGRAIEFFKTLQSKEEMLITQLDSKELAAIHQVIAGELKAVQAIKAEFKATFGIDEEELELLLQLKNKEISEK